MAIIISLGEKMSAAIIVDEIATDENIKNGKKIFLGKISAFLIFVELIKKTAIKMALEISPTVSTAD